MTYGALSAKIRALYGKRLRLDEGALASCTSYDQLLDAARDTIYARCPPRSAPSTASACGRTTLPGWPG